MKAQEIIEQIYELEENPQAYFEASPLTLRLDIQYLDMLQAMADRFKTSRAGLGKQFLEASIYEAFEALNDKDRLDLSRKFDESSGWWQEQNYALQQKSAGKVDPPELKIVS